MKLHGEEEESAQSANQAFQLKSQECEKIHCGPSKPDQLQLSTTEQSQPTPGWTGESFNWEQRNAWPQNNKIENGYYFEMLNLVIFLNSKKSAPGTPFVRGLCSPKNLEWLGTSDT